MNNKKIIIADLLIIFLVLLKLPVIFGGIHNAPIIIPGYKIKGATRYPISSYRLFRTFKNGSVQKIPFQIDELNEWGDYVLDKGSPVTKNDGNGIFDFQDELVLMGNDVGMLNPPKKWGKIPKPDLIYEIAFLNPITAKTGAVYLGVYLGGGPDYSKKKYLIFNKNKGEIYTARYLYSFDKKNYLVAKKVDMINKISGKKTYTTLFNSSTFYLKADLKYFLTFEINHRSINSYLEAYKVGPIRAIVRVTFFYRFLKINFELGMYTEVSLFANSVTLPAILYNPLNGTKNLNKGSGFYYGFAFKDNPDTYTLKTNIPFYKKNGFFSSLLSSSPEPKADYWVSMVKPDRMIYFSINLSNELVKSNIYPMLYKEPISSNDLIKSRDNNKALPLGKAPVNIAMYFDLTKFSKGEHQLAIHAYFENKYSKKLLDSFKTLKDWNISLTRF